MKCPKCGKEIANDSKFCEYCGTKVSSVTESISGESKHETSGWMKVSIVLLFFNVALGSLALGYYNKLDIQKEKHNNEILSLKSHLPKEYRTKYHNQYVYNLLYNETSYEQRSDLWFKEEGTPVTIYCESNGYGLTKWGWIPMSRLENY